MDGGLVWGRRRERETLHLLSAFHCRQTHTRKNTPSCLYLPLYSCMPQPSANDLLYTKTFFFSFVYVPRGCFFFLLETIKSLVWIKHQNYTHQHSQHCYHRLRFLSSMKTGFALFSLRHVENKSLTRSSSISAYILAPPLFVQHSRCLR